MITPEGENEKKDEILVCELIIGIPTDAFVMPSLCTHVAGYTERKIVSKTHNV
jgi:hypothetical protein